MVPNYISLSFFTENIWGYGEWSSCKRILNEYVQERQAECQTPGSLEVLEEDVCDEETKPEPQIRRCSEGIQILILGLIQS